VTERLEAKSLSAAPSGELLVGEGGR